MSRGDPNIRSCVDCGDPKAVRILESRRSTDDTVRRRLHCLACGARWRSREVVEKIIHAPNALMRSFDWSI